MSEEKNIKKIEKVVITTHFEDGSAESDELEFITGVGVRANDGSEPSAEGVNKVELTLLRVGRISPMESIAVNRGLAQLLDPLLLALDTVSGSSLERAEEEEECE